MASSKWSAWSLLVAYPKGDWRHGMELNQGNFTSLQGARKAFLSFKGIRRHFPDAKSFPKGARLRLVRIDTDNRRGTVTMHDLGESFVW